MNLPQDMIVSGEVHAWRLDPERWGTILDRVAELGFRFVATYVPWSVHETAPGSFDFTGPRDVVRFIEMAGERGLGVIVRPGPNAGAELETSGWPRRVLDDPRCQARRPDGRPYLLMTSTHHAFMPSYASRVVLDEVARWYDAVVPRLAPLQDPDGPVVACQVDNEMGYHFQPHAFALDYHPDAIAQYRLFLASQDGTAHAALGDVHPPRDGTDEPEARRVDWVRFKEEHLRTSIATLAGMLRERGMDRVPLVHNDYPRTTTPMDAGALEASGAVDVAAADVYSTKEGGRFVADLVRHLCGSTRFPFLAELGAGWLTLPWLLPVGPTAQDEEVVTLRALCAGARGINVYMLVERDRWYGSPIAPDGTPRDKAALYRRLHDLIAGAGWSSLRRVAPVLLVENRTEVRRAAARDTGGEAVPCFSQLLPLDPRLWSPDHPDTDELRRWDTELARVLREAGIDFDRASSSSLPDLARYRTVLMPSLDSFDPGVWPRLAGAAARVGVGPRIPSLDERLRPADFQRDGIELLAAPSDAAALCPEPEYRTESPALDLHLFRSDTREVLAAFNHSGEALDAKVVFEGAAVFEGLWRPERLEAEGSVSVAMPPWGVQVWGVVR